MSRSEIIEIDIKSDFIIDNGLVDISQNNSTEA